jgi:hypothetical protein
MLDEPASRPDEEVHCAQVSASMRDASPKLAIELATRVAKAHRPLVRRSVRFVTELQIRDTRLQPQITDLE